MTKEQIKNKINKVRKSNAVEFGTKVFQGISGLGAMHIVAFAVTAVMPVTVKLPIRLCVRAATTVLAYKAADKTSDYAKEYVDELFDEAAYLVDSIKVSEEKDSEEEDLNAKKREDYIQKRTEAKRDNSESLSSVPKPVNVVNLIDSVVLGYDKDETAIGAWRLLKDCICFDDSETIRHKTNYMYTNPYIVEIPKSIVEKDPMLNYWINKGGEMDNG